VSEVKGIEMADRSETLLLEEKWRRAERQEILDRLNAYDGGVHEDDRRKARQSEIRRETERQMALGIGRYRLGTL
jgi:hypothetical protein